MSFRTVGACVLAVSAVIACGGGPKADPSVKPARMAPGVPHDLPELYWERNVRTAMQDGLAARVRFPSLADAKFLRDPARQRPRAPGGRSR